MCTCARPQTTLDVANAGGVSLNATATVSLPFIPSNGVDLALNGTLRSSGYESWAVPCVLAGATDVMADSSFYECDATLLQKVVSFVTNGRAEDMQYVNFAFPTEPFCVA